MLYITVNVHTPINPRLTFIIFNPTCLKKNAFGKIIFRLWWPQWIRSLLIELSWTYPYSDSLIKLDSIYTHPKWKHDTL